VTPDCRGEVIRHLPARAWATGSSSTLAGVPDLTWPITSGTNVPADRPRRPGAIESSATRRSPAELPAVAPDDNALRQRPDWATAKGSVEGPSSVGASVEACRRRPGNDTASRSARLEGSTSTIRPANVWKFPIHADGRYLGRKDLIKRFPDARLRRHAFDADCNLYITRQRARGPSSS